MTTNRSDCTGTIIQMIAKWLVLITFRRIDKNLSLNFDSASQQRSLKWFGVKIVDDRIEIMER